MKYSSQLLASSIVAFGVFAFFAFASSSDNVSGWAWSENIGWISFNCTNSPGLCDLVNYGVNVATSGDLSGFAWSETVGWISFNSADITSCPSSPCSPKLNKGTGRLEGWAKAFSADGNGWDGWIHLSGTNYASTVRGCHYDGYAWGSDTVGWINFKGTNYGVTGSGDACVPGVSITADGSGSAITVPYAGRVNICWNDTQATSCIVDPTGWTGTSDCQTSDSLTSDTTFTVKCDTATGKISNSVFVAVEIPPLNASCAVAPTEAKAGQTVTWSASASGGTGSYGFGWNGSPNPNPLDGKIGNPVYISYTTLGTQSGSVTVTSGSQTYTANCADSVNIVPGILNFTASPSKIVLGQSSKLDWDSIGFTSCSLNQGIGAVALKGTKIITPKTTATYTLSCIGSSDSKSVTVTILQEPEFIEIYPQEIVPK